MTVIHHIDGDPMNNDPANLRLVDPATNSNLHIIIGHAPCLSCGSMVVYGTARIRGNSGNVRAWRDPATGRKHTCKREGDIE